jgi:hypothetical protein
MTINSATENTYVANLIPDWSWIGFTDTGTVPTYHWVSGQAVTYTHWGPGEPSTPSTFQCVAMSVQHGQYQLGDWYSSDCSDNINVGGYVCEKGI